MKKCNKCNNEKPIKDFHKNKTRADGHHYWCKTCMSIDKKRYIKENPEKAKETRNNANKLVHSRFLQLKRGAKQRNLFVEITEEEFESLLKTNECFYCLGPLNPNGHGMDRYDNDKGYTKDNIKPCCAICNSMKSKLHGNDFIRRIHKIANNKRNLICL